MLRSYKYRLFPNREQQSKLSNYFGCIRFVYNLGLETKISAWTSAKKNINFFDLSNQLTELKKTDAIWLKECPSQPLQMALRNLDNAYTSFFRGGGFPKFKSKKNKQSIQFPQSVKVDFDDNLVILPKLGNITCIFDRTFSGTIKTCTVSKTNTDKYFISILVETGNPIPNKSSINESNSIGIDLGLTHFLITSDGNKYNNPKFYQKSQRNLRIQQRSLSRKQKGSNRYEKQKLVVAKLHEHVTNQRKDFLQKISTLIIKKYDTIIVENLNIDGMMKNDKLSKSIGDVSWGSFISMLVYKSEWTGKNLIKIGRFDPSSKMCSCCGSINKELKLHHRKWVCKNCNTEHDRDINAAINIKNFGLRCKPSIVNVDQ